VSIRRGRSYHTGREAISSHLLHAYTRFGLAWQPFSKHTYLVGRIASVSACVYTENRLVQWVYVVESVKMRYEVK
jgi:hypothetical protein